MNGNDTEYPAEDQGEKKPFPLITKFVESTVTEALEKLDAFHVRRMKWINAHRRMLRDALIVAGEFDLRDYNDDPAVDLGWELTTIPGVLLKRQNLLSFDEAAPIVDRLRKMGYKSIRGDDFAAMRRRTLTFIPADVSLREMGVETPRISLMMFLSDDDEALRCKIVEYGEPTYEKKFMCPDSPVPEVVPE